MRVGKSQILMGVIQLLSAEKRKSALILKTCETIVNPTILGFIMKKLLMLVTSVASIMMALPAAAQFAKPEDAVKYRKASFTVMAAHFSRVGAMASGRAPYDAKAAAENADIAAAMAKLPWAAFTEGSDKGDTRAKPEIWKDSAKFKESADKMQVELGKVAVAAKAGNVDALKTAFGPAAATCKGCHDNFRKE
jgi:cytochrome c556